MYGMTEGALSPLSTGIARTRSGLVYLPVPIFVAKRQPYRAGLRRRGFLIAQERFCFTVRCPENSGAARAWLSHKSSRSENFYGDEAVGSRSRVAQARLSDKLVNPRVNRAMRPGQGTNITISYQTGFSSQS